MVALRTSLRWGGMLLSAGGMSIFTAKAQAHAACPPPRCKTVSLASTVSSPLRPTVVLVHGLDSSKQTWSTVISNLTAEGYPAIAFDLRGMGESNLGEEQDFSPETLAMDVIEATNAAGVPRPFVLVGHSMGGRVAMRLAAIATEEAKSGGGAPMLAACIIEDMDVRPRWTPPILKDAETAILAAFDRRCPSWKECKAKLEPWYSEERVQGWKGFRIREEADGSWWSDINPIAQRLAMEHVLASSDGANAWQYLAREKPSFPVHVWVADSPGTVCDWTGPGSIGEMHAQMPSALVRKFEGSHHSIHNSVHAEFMSALKGIVDEAGRQCPEPSCSAGPPLFLNHGPASA